MRVVFLVLNVFGFGGTVRTVVTTVNQLARRDDLDVQVISVFQSASRPHFSIDPRVRITALHRARGTGDASPGKPPSWLGPGFRSRVRQLVKKRLTRTRARLFHRDEEAFEMLNAVIDMRVVRAIRKQRDSILVPTRPGLNLLCARFRHRSVLLVGQEHLHFDAHAPALKRSIERLYPRLDLLAVLTEADEQRYREVLGSRVPILRIPNALPALEPVTADLRSKEFVAAGRLVPQKGFDLLIEAFASVVKRHPDWRLKIHGAGPERQALERRIEELGLTRHVALMGLAEQLEREMASASAFVLSSRFEGFGMVLVEAMSVGLPVISFDCPYGPSEIVQHGETGLLVPDGDIPGLSDAMVHLIEHPDERRTMGASGRLAVRRFDAERIGETWYQVLRELRASTSPRSGGVDGRSASRGVLRTTDGT